MGKSNALHALGVALIVFFTLLVVLAVIWVNVDFSSFGFRNGFLGALLLIASLVTVIVYQSLRISYTAEEMAENLALDVVVSSKELFRELYLNSPVPYILIDNNGTITSTNFSTVRLFGVEKGVLDGRNVFDFIESDQEYDAAMLPEKLRQGLFVNQEDMRITRPDGEVKWVLLSLFSFHDSEGKRTGLLTLVDITKQKQIDKVKTEFVSLASHQLRTPISSMKWNLELLRTRAIEGMSEEQEEYVSKIERNAYFMDALIDDFLSVSKLELGTLEVDLKVIPIEKSLNEVIEEYKPKAKQKDVTVTLHINETIEQYETDPQLFHMIASNLVSNAIKYSYEGGPVDINYGIERGKFFVSVEDKGMGIPEKDKDMIFAKIFRASNARLNVPEGTGLGLYIVKEAAKVLGGDVTFVSKENQGSTFTAMLPK